MKKNFNKEVAKIEADIVTLKEKNIVSESLKKHSIRSLGEIGNPLNNMVVKKLPLNECFEKDGTPIKCPGCGSSELVDKDHSYLDNTGPLLEYGVYCKCCNKRVTYWAYGNWEYYPEEREK